MCLECETTASTGDLWGQCPILCEFMGADASPAPLVPPPMMVGKERCMVECSFPTVIQLLNVLGIDFREKYVQIGMKVIKLQVLDTFGGVIGYGSVPYSWIRTSNVS